MITLAVTIKLDGAEFGNPDSIKSLDDVVLATLGKGGYVTLDISELRVVTPEGWTAIENSQARCPSRVQLAGLERHPECPSHIRQHAARACTA